MFVEETPLAVIEWQLDRSIIAWSPAAELIFGYEPEESRTLRIANERLKDEFVSIVSHELRTPVTSIKGSLGLLMSGVLDDDSEKSRELLAIALLNTNRLQMLINDILDVDKLESGKMDYHFRSCDLAPLVDEVLRPMQPMPCSMMWVFAGPICRPPAWCTSIRIESSRY